jgi:hypothetical protein
MTKIMSNKVSFSFRGQIGRLPSKAYERSRREHEL